MKTTKTLPYQLDHQHRLKTMTKRLVIELGYLESCLAKDLHNAHVSVAAAGLDTAIACLNDLLAS